MTEREKAEVMSNAIDEWLWSGMPEYNNRKEKGPLIEVKFKFKDEESFQEFNRLLKEHVYGVKKVFDGMQRKNDYQAWFPLRTKGSDYVFK